MPKKHSPIKINLNKLCTDLSVGDDRDGVNVKVVEVKIVIAALGQHLRHLPPDHALATVAAICERAGL